MRVIGRWVVSVGLLFLVLLVVVFQLGRAKAPPATARDVVVAEVGRERLYLSGLNQAVAPVKYRLEQEGYDFDSARGRSLYQQLQSNVLNNMIVRALLDQGLKEQGIGLSRAELAAGYRKELAKRKQTEKELLAELPKYGWTKAIFLADLRRTLLERKFLDRLAKGATGEARDAAVNEWLSRRAAAAGVKVYFQVNSGGGDVLREAEKAALAYYRRKYGNDQGVSAKAQSYGCHIQVDIVRNGKVVKSLGYSGGEIYEI